MGHCAAWARLFVFAIYLVCHAHRLPYLGQGLLRDLSCPSDPLPEYAMDELGVLFQGSSALAERPEIFVQGFREKGFQSRRPGVSDL